LIAVSSFRNERKDASRIGKTSLIQQLDKTSQANEPETMQPMMFDENQFEQPQMLQEPVMALEPERRSLNSKEENFLNDLQNGNAFFHDLAPPHATKRKEAASMFYMMLSK
jgi:hypothetical protein